MKFLTVIETLKRLLPLLKPALRLFVLWLAKRKGRQEERAKQMRIEAEKQRKYGEIAGEHRTADDVADRLRKGDF